MDDESANWTRVVTCMMFTVLCLPDMILWAQGDFQVDASGAFMRGLVHARIQTPSGGEPGTTSSGRPSLAELGIDDADVGDFQADLVYGRHGVYLGGRIMRLSGTSTLDSVLISQGVMLPAGSVVDSDVRFDWYRLGYRYVPSGERAIYLSPSIGATLLDFRYELTSPGLEKVDRVYSKAGAQVGFDMTWPWSDGLSLCGQVLLPVPISHWPQILSTQLALKYRFFKRDHLSVSGLLGIDHDWIYYKDSQSTPNDIRANIGPMGLVGLEVKF